MKIVILKSRKSFISSEYEYRIAAVEDAMSLYDGNELNPISIVETFNDCIVIDKFENAIRVAELLKEDRGIYDDFSIVINSKDPYVFHLYASEEKGVLYE